MECSLKVKNKLLIEMFLLFPEQKIIEMKSAPFNQYFLKVVYVK